jgi:hypothetical protein
MAAGSSTVNFTGLSSSMAPSFNFAGKSSALIWFENEGLGHQHPDRKARSDGDARLDIPRSETVV